MMLLLEPELEMATIHIQGADLTFAETDVITFDEGLIGLPHLEQMVLVRQSNIAPFLWLASLDDPDLAFLVVDPRLLFPDFKLQTPETATLPSGEVIDEAPLLLAIVSIAPDWTQSTINLRAPLFISPSTMRGAQIALSDSPYRLDEPLPRELLAA
jgi:flagellar assembly factor FliW